MKSHPYSYARSHVWDDPAGLQVASTVARIHSAPILTLTVGVGVNTAVVTDAVTFTLVPAALFLVSVAASCVPALRASRVSPVVALQED
jgi:ABC-type lipoprotein release transport system permease subunit